MNVRLRRTTPSSVIPAAESRNPSRGVGPLTLSTVEGSSGGGPPPTPHPPIPAPDTGTLPTERGIPFPLS